jgi:hypothetical protein
MRTVIRGSGCALGLLLAASAAWAQPADKPADDGRGVHRMEIFNGPVRTVHYIYGPGLAPNEAAAVRDLERAENGVALADELQQLRFEYVRNEREMERYRHHIQMLLYGYSSETSGNPLNLLGGSWGGSAWGGWYYPGYGLTGPYAAAYPFVGPGWGGYGGTASNSLAWGMGDEGVIKNAVAGTLVDVARPDYAVRASATYNAALAHASQYESVRSALGLKQALPAPPPPPGPEKDKDKDKDKK